MASRETMKKKQDNFAELDGELSARERLILAALDVIEEVGFARFSLRRVASVCGLSCSAPYKHFKTKEK